MGEQNAGCRDGGSGATTNLDWARVWEVFHAALERPEHARTAWVVDALAGVPAARREVLSLLEAHARPDSPLDRPAVALLGLGGLDEVAGGWRLIRRLGDGGMGEVHLAARSDGDYEQLAAIKLVDAPPGEDALFVAERRALAKMRHPHIAQLYDSGMSEDGRHYLVMEYVEGDRLDRWLDASRPTLQQRLSLFVEICRAVHHAHRNLIVHRDLKPSNVLLTADGAPKLIDFGIAAAPGSGAVRLTPAYASPEQLRGEAVTTASDVFTLGVLLYEMVAGEPPFGRGKTSIAERLSRIDAGPASLEAQRNRQATLASIGRFRRSELDALFAAVLAPQPERRYGSAEALAADVERWLRKRPLAVRGESFRYRVRSAIERHPGTFSLVTVALLALLAAIVLLALQGQRLRQALAQAQLQTRRAEQAAGFLAGLFTEADPEQRHGDAASAAELLRQGAARLPAIDDRELRDGLELTIARALLHAGELQASEPHFRALLEQPATRAAALQGLAALAQERGDHADAERLQREAVERLEGDNPGQPAVDEADIWRARLKLAAILQSLGRLDQASTRLEGITAQRVSLDLAAEANIRLGSLAWGRGDLRRAEQHYRDALAHYMDAHGVPNHLVARARYALGTALHRQGRHDDARVEYEQALAQRLAVYGERHPRVAETFEAMAALAYDAGDAAGAVDLGTKALAMKRELYGDAGPTLGLSHTNLALALHELGRFDAAQAHYRAALLLNQQAFDEGHPDVVGSFGNLALLALDRGRLQTARDWIEQARPLAARLPERHRIRAFIDHLAGRERLQSGDLESAERLLDAGLAARRAHGDGRHPHVADSLYWLAWLALAQGRMDLAAARSRESLEIRGETLEDGDWRVAQSRVQVAALDALASGKSGSEALDDAVRGLIRARGEDDWRWAALQRRLAGHGLAGLR